MLSLVVVLFVITVNGQGLFYDSFEEPFCPYTTCVLIREFIFQANASMIGPSKVFAMTAYSMLQWPRNDNVHLCYKMVGVTVFEGCVPSPMYLSDPPLGYVGLPPSGKVHIQLWMSDMKTTNFTFHIAPHIYPQGSTCSVSDCRVGPLCEYCPTDCDSACDPPKQAFCHCSSTFTRGSPFCGCMSGNQ